jgi:hypothetical protein
MNKGAGGSSSQEFLQIYWGLNRIGQPVPTGRPVSFCLTRVLELSVDWPIYTEGFPGFILCIRR